MEQGQHAVDDVVGTGAIGRRHALLDVREEVAVAQHRGPRRAGGAAGEHHDRDMIGGNVANRGRVSGEQLTEGDLTLAGGAVGLGVDDRTQRRHPTHVDVRPRRHGTRAEHHHDRRDLDQLALDLRAGAGRIERHGDPTEPDARRGR